MEAMKRDDGMIVFVMTPREAELLARKMAEAMGDVTYEELEAAIEEVHQ